MREVGSTSRVHAEVANHELSFTHKMSLQSLDTLLGFYTNIGLFSFRNSSF